MSYELMIVILAGVAISWANGSNDVSKGIATLVGAGVADYKRALHWGTLFTAIGAITGAFFAHAMVETFGGDLLTAVATPDMAAAIATIGGAAGWVLLSTLTGLPVSTTHAIVGSLLGVSIMAFGIDGIAWNTLIWKVALPLLLSPFAALAATMILRKIWHQWHSAKTSDPDCICVSTSSELSLSTGVAAATIDYQPSMVVSTCAIHGNQTIGAKAIITVDKLHWLSAGLTSFARGMNDAPKLAGLMLAAAMLSGESILGNQTAFMVVAVAMTAGGLMAGLRVTKVLAEKVTVMNHHEGFTANIVTSTLVSAGAVFGLPMSTTHVSSSALIGIGVSGAKGNLHMGMVKKLLAAWVITLPGSAFIGIILFWLARLAQ